MIIENFLINFGTQTVVAIGRMESIYQLTASSTGIHSRAEKEYRIWLEWLALFRFLNETGLLASLNNITIFQGSDSAF